MKISFLFLTLWFSLTVFAQRPPGSMIHPLPKSTDNMSVIDTFNIRVWYAFNADSIDKPDTYMDMHRLEIGRQYSKYYSFFVFNSDSLCTVWVRKHPSAQSRPWGLGSRGKYPYRWSEYKYSEYFIDYSAAQFTEFCRMPMYMHGYNSQSSEPIPVQEWKICNDTMSVIGYKCQKATCSFRGRTYEGWFTMEVPVDKGPWKFSGLPGLILKVNDVKHQYTFEGIKIEFFEKGLPIKKYDDYSTYKKISREELLKFPKTIYKNYSGKRDKSGKYIPPSTPYEPLELY